MLDLNAQEYEALTGILLGVFAHARISLNNRKGNNMSSPAVADATDYRVMFDSATVSAIPLDAEIIAYYPESFGGDIKPWEGKAAIVGIDNEGGHPELGILDVETGAATFADIPGWLEKHYEKHGTKGTIYCDETNLAQVEKIVARTDHGANLWIADWTGKPHVYTGGTGVMTLVATQYQSPKTVPASAGDYDLSIVNDADWHPSPKPAESAATVAEPTTESATSAAEVSATTGKLLSGVIVQVVNGQLSFSRVQSVDGKNWTQT